MTSKAVLAIAAGAILWASSVPSTAVTVAPIAAARHLSDMHRVTFGGWPFPHGYAWSRVRACTRHIPIETTDGHIRWQRVWVCSDEGRYSRRWK